MRVIEPIAIIHTDFPEKFGVPRQSGLASTACGEIVFMPEYRQIERIKGLEKFSHIWLIWDFSEHTETKNNTTVRPPRLGGKEHVGVFASRSPFRPNGLGLSSVKIEGIEYSESKGPIIKVSGVDMLDGSPIYDIKPYIPYTDCIVDATDGYTEHTKDYRLQVVCPDSLLSILPEDKRSAVFEVLALDPRPTFLNAPNRIYGMFYAEYNIKFKVEDLTLTVVDIQKELQ